MPLSRVEFAASVKRLAAFARMLLGLGACASLSAHAWAEAQVPAARVHVRIDGPVAFVSVERELAVGVYRPKAGARVSVFDFALPEGASGLTVELGTPEARVAPWPALTSPPVVPPLARQAPRDASAAVRVAFEGLRESEHVTVRYAFSLPLACEEGAWTLRMPGAVDLAPAAATVSLDVALPSALRLASWQFAGRDLPVPGSARRRLQATAEASAHASWALSFVLRDPRTPAASAMAVRFRAPASRAVGAQGFVATCRGQGLPQGRPPGAVLALVDGSRSVGVAGLSLEREFVTAFMEALPAGVPWNALLFAQRSTPVFPVFRLPTRESLAQFAGALEPSRLANGTDWRGAVAAATQALGAPGAPPTSCAEPPWLLVVGDASLPDGLRPEAGVAAGGPARERCLRVAAVVLRPEGDEAPHPLGSAAYRALPEAFGGLYRSLRPPGVNAAATRLAKEMSGAEGDWFGLAWNPGGVEGPPHLSPGAGTARLWPRQRPWPRQVVYRSEGHLGRVPLRTLPDPIAWPVSNGLAVATVLGFDDGRGGRSWVWRLPPADAEGAPVGDLERSVVHNALSLAYLPRARACYLNRRANAPGARSLTGRVRLALDLERGEMLGARVLASTLGHPEIEACLTQAAYALTIPRPVGRDAPTLAILNLVFRPTTEVPEGGVAPDASAFDQDIELLLEPLRRRGELDLDAQGGENRSK